MKKAKTILLISALLLTFIATKQLNVMPKIRHGLSKTKEYHTWISMLGRCNNPKHIKYKEYGSRGITVCQRWNDSFLNFLNDIGHAPSSKHSIDRIDGTLGYSPNNCRWATPDQQNNNRSNNIVIEFMGESKTLTQWGREYGLKKGTIYNRFIVQGWPIEKALTKPLGRQGKHPLISGV